MTSDQHWRALTVLVIATAVAGTAAAAVTPAPTTDLLSSGEEVPVAAAHIDDMGVREYIAPRVNPSRPSPSRAPARLREPTTLAIAALGVKSTVVTTTMDDGRSVVVPEDVLLTGWYDGSRRLGARQGSTVIVGHRDSAAQGSGALYGIEELPIGARIRVSTSDGTTYDFTVQSIEVIDKANLPSQAPRIFTRSGPHRLVLITCGGAFDPSAGSYLSNVVVTATPVTASANPR